MPPKRKPRTSQRKLNFDGHRRADPASDDVIVIDDDDDDTVRHLNETPKSVSAHNRKRSATSASSTPPTAKASRQENINSFVSPKKESRRSAPAIVTPAADEGIRGPPSQAKSTYTPNYIHKNIEYLRQGQSTMSPRTAKVSRWILGEYYVPDDIEQDRSFGPLSGSSYEERIIAAYSVGKLIRRPTTAQPNNCGGTDTETPLVMICTSCAELGHVRDKCPLLM